MDLPPSSFSWPVDADENADIGFDSGERGNIATGKFCFSLSANTCE
jgi:hypothetical protein